MIQRVVDPPPPAPRTASGARPAGGAPLALALVIGIGALVGGVTLERIVSRSQGRVAAASRVAGIQLRAAERVGSTLASGFPLRPSLFLELTPVYVEAVDDLADR